VLTAAITETLEDAGLPAPVVAGTLRRDDGGPARLLASLAEVFVRGVAVDWAAVLGGAPGELPTYAFQRQRYWPGRAGERRRRAVEVFSRPDDAEVGHGHGMQAGCWPRADDQRVSCQMTSPCGRRKAPSRWTSRGSTTEPGRRRVRVRSGIPGPQEGLAARR
jgi:acyl transferase domain-containing protein